MNECVNRAWQLIIGGEFVPGGAGNSAVRNPATGEVVVEAPVADVAQVEMAIQAARRALPHWRWAEPERRGAILFECAARIEAHRDELADIETIENGKPRSQSMEDVTNAARTFRFYGAATDKFYGSAIWDSPTEVRKQVYEPRGVVAAIIPWNWPPMHTADFAAVALATGNTVILKPAPETPLSTLRMLELFLDLFPAGAINVVTGGVEIGAALTRHPGIDFIAFTGSDRNGEKILAAAAPNITPCMMELGGKNATLVFPDAQLDKAVAGLLRSVFHNSGQACSGTERLLVHNAIMSRFLEAFLPRVKQLVVGDGFDKRAEVGPMINGRQCTRILAVIEGAKNSGAEIAASAATPAERRLAGGYWVPPTILTGVSTDMPVMREETFGPVVGIMGFDDEEEAIALANGVDYGLTSAVWTRDIGCAHRVASRLEAGLVAVNTANGGRLGLPFGGYKRSGMGRKKDFIEAMRTFSQVKAIQIDLT